MLKELLLCQPENETSGNLPSNSYVPQWNRVVLVGKLYFYGSQVRYREISDTSRL